MTKWYSVAEYSKKTGMCKSTIHSKIASGELEYSTTEGGGKYLIRYETNDELLELKDELAETKLILLRLCAHLGIKTN